MSIGDKGNFGHDGEDLGHADCEVCNEARDREARKVTSEAQAKMNLAAVYEWLSVRRGE